MNRFIRELLRGPKRDERTANPDAQEAAKAKRLRKQNRNLQLCELGGLEYAGHLKDVESFHPHVYPCCNAFEHKSNCYKMVKQ